LPICLQAPQRQHITGNAELCGLSRPSQRSNFAHSIGSEQNF
jgi:hypothetical protein